ncbi:hypothetical protein Tco_1466845 [Tanacetum coccineum]
MVEVVGGVLGKRRCLEDLELTGGDGCAYKVLGWLLGDVMVMQGRLIWDKKQGYIGGLHSVMSSDSAVTYTSVHSEARSWSIPSEDPYEEAARQLLEQAPRPSKYVPDPMELEDHVPMYIPEPDMRHL